MNEFQFNSLLSSSPFSNKGNSDTKKNAKFESKYLEKVSLLVLFFYFPSIATQQGKLSNESCIDN